MKQLLMIVLALILYIVPVMSQTNPNDIPWDRNYKIHAGDKRTIQGEKGKVIVITFISSKAFEGAASSRYDITVKKKDSQTGEFFTSELPVGWTSHCNYMLREQEEIAIDAKSSVIMFFSGYEYMLKQ